MKHSLFTLLCTLAIVAAQGRSMQQSGGSVEPDSTAPAEATSNRTFASSIEAANITANVSIAVGILDAWGEATPLQITALAVHACAAQTTALRDAAAAKLAAQWLSRSRLCWYQLHACPVCGCL
jgi:hypothetical protein